MDVDSSADTLRKPQLAERMPARGDISCFRSNDVAADRHVRQRPFPQNDGGEWPRIAPSADVEQPQIAPLRTVGGGQGDRHIKLRYSDLRKTQRTNISHWFRDEMMNWPALLSTNDFNLLHCLEARVKGHGTNHRSSCHTAVCAIGGM